MIFFKVTENINIKVTDGSLVSYLRHKLPTNMNNETIYVTTFDDYEDIKKVFKNVDEKKYQTRLIKESKVRALEEFPIELGISNYDEYRRSIEYKKDIRNFFYTNKTIVEEFLFSNRYENFVDKLKVRREKIKVAVIGTCGDSIGQMICSCTALRIFYNKLKSFYKEVKLDIYLKASNNSFYSRDKRVYSKQDFINEVKPLGLSVKRLCEYDYFVDTSMVTKKSVYYNALNYTDAWLYKLGIKFNEISPLEKYNHINLKNAQVSNELKDRIDEIKRKDKILLFHPYSANKKKSIPQDYAVKFLRELVKKSSDYTVVTALQVDGKLNDDRYVNLSSYSKNIDDLMYIISNCDNIITVHTSVMHMSDIFMIPTVVLSNTQRVDEDIKYYQYVKSYKLEDKTKSLSKFVFENDELEVYKHEAWKEVKVSKIIKLLDSF